jgi:hypothetical protein
MKKIYEIFLIVILIMSCFSCNQKNAAKMESINRIAVKSNPIKIEDSDNNKVKTKSYIKGKVHHWITDTVYLTTMPYYSPYSNKTYYQTLSKDSTFQFDFHDMDKPIIIQLAPTKAAIDGNINTLLFDNLTDKHYFGQCEKFNTYQLTTYLLEPNDSILVELNFNSWIEKLSDKKAKYLKSLGVKVSEDNNVRDYGKTGITFLTQNKSSLEYYQKWFAVDDKFDSEIERSRNVDDAYSKVYKLKEKLLSDLQQAKSAITPFLFDHLKAYIEFSARKEFLKNLILKDKDYLKGQVNDEIIEFLEFNKNEIDFAILSCDQYNDYLEFYLTYKRNRKTGNNSEYYAFNKEKFQFASSELPVISRYYYLANQLLHQEKTIENKDLLIQLVKEYPNGVLNEDLKDKYQ